MKKDNREPMKQWRDRQKRNGKKPVMIWLGDGHFKELNRFKRVMGLTQAESIEYLIDALISRSNYRPPQDILCPKCSGYGCVLCNNSGWYKTDKVGEDYYA